MLIKCKRSQVERGKVERRVRKGIGSVVERLALRENLNEALTMIDV